MADNGDYNTSQLPLRGVIMCCTSIPPEKRVSTLSSTILDSDLASIASQMGAVHKLDLTSDVTHLIVGDRDTPKYKYVAKERSDVKCLLPDWIEAVRLSWIEGGETEVVALEAQYTVPTFAGLRVCVTGFEDLVLRKELEETVNSNGGEYRGDLTKEVTHLIALKPTGNKYNYAKQWGIRVVSIEWLQHSLERGMILEENLYDPLLPAPERGHHAWVRRTASTSTLGKRAREAEVLPIAKRKLRRTASAKLSTQNDGIWTDIVGGGFGLEEMRKGEWDDQQLASNGTANETRQETGVMEDEELRDESTSRLQDNELPIAGPVAKPSATQGLFQGKRFYVHGFDVKKRAVLEEHLRSHSAEISQDMAQLGQGSSPSAADSAFLLVPHASDEDMPSTRNRTLQPTIVTDMWIERCIFSKIFVQPETNVLNMPFRRHPIPGFQEMVICSTSFQDIELVHVSKAVRLIGATYDEFLTPKTSVLVCNSNESPSEKLRHALEWDVPVVKADWLWDCIRTGHRKPFETYLIQPTTTHPKGTKESQDAEVQTNVLGKMPTNTDTRKDAVKSISNLVGQTKHPPSRTIDPGGRSSQFKASISRDDVNNDMSFNDDNNECTSQPPRDDMKSGNPEFDSSTTLRADPAPLQELSPNSPPKPSPRSKSPPAFKSAHIEEPHKRDSLSTAITSLLAHHQREPSNPPSCNASEAPKLGRRKRQLFGRAPSNLSARSVSLSRASSVDTMNTDGVGTPLEVTHAAAAAGQNQVRLSSKEKNNEKEKQKEKEKAITASLLAGYTQLQGLEQRGWERANGDGDDDDEEARQKMQMTQLGYEDPDAELWRERLARKMRQGKPAAAGEDRDSGAETRTKVKGIGTVRDVVGVGGEGVASRTRHAGGRS